MIQKCDSASVDEQLRTSTVVSPDFLDQQVISPDKISSFPRKLSCLPLHCYCVWLSC